MVSDTFFEGGVRHLFLRRGAFSLSVLLDDLLHTFRPFARNPNFAAAVVATLALGIGVNTAVFSVFNGRPSSATTSGWGASAGIRASSAAGSC